MTRRNALGLVAAGSAALTTPAAAAPGLAGTAPSLSATARAFFAAYARGDVDAMVALFAPDATFDYVPFGEAGRGSVARDAAPVWRSYIEAFGGFTPEVQELWEDPVRRTVIAATINRGIHRADVGGIRATGRQLAAPHLFILGFDEAGRIAKITAYWDMLTVFGQIGFPQGFAAQVAAGGGS